MKYKLYSLIKSRSVQEWNRIGSDSFFFLPSRFDAALQEAAQVDKLIEEETGGEEVLEDRLPLLGVPLTVKHSHGLQGILQKSNTPSVTWNLALHFDYIQLLFRRDVTSFCRVGQMIKFYQKSDFDPNQFISCCRWQCDIFPSCRHALQYGCDLQARGPGHWRLSTCGPAEESGGHPSGRHQHQWAVHVVWVPQPPLRHHQQPVRLGEDSGRKFRWAAVSWLGWGIGSFRQGMGHWCPSLSPGTAPWICPIIIKPWFC